MCGARASPNVRLLSKPQHLAPVLAFALANFGHRSQPPTEVREKLFTATAGSSECQRDNIARVRSTQLEAKLALTIAHVFEFMFHSFLVIVAVKLFS